MFALNAFYGILVLGYCNSLQLVVKAVVFFGRYFLQVAG